MFPSHRVAGEPQPQPRQTPSPPPTPNSHRSSANRVRAPWRTPSSSELPPLEPGFLSPLQRQQQLVTRLLQVHALSDAIAYEPHAALRVNATAWWQELQQQSATAVRQRHSRKRRLINNNGTSNGSTNGSMDVSMALSQARQESLDETKDVRVEMLVKILYSLSAWTKSRIESDRATIEPEIQQVLIHIESAIGEVGMKLLDDWWRTCASSDDTNDDSESVTPSTTTNKNSDVSAAAAATQCSVEIVNVLLQFCDPVGTFHAFHTHKLCCCTAQRVFRSKPRWSCSKCARAWETQPAKPDPILVFRCAACEFTLCRECYTRIPNASHELQEIAIARELFSKPPSELHGTNVSVDGVLPLVLRHVHAHDVSLFATLAPKLAIAARDRLQELLLYRSQEMVPMLQMVVDLFAIPGFARVFITREPQLWMPLYISSAKMRLYSFLGPLMLWTSMSDEPGEINLTPEGRRDGKSTALTLQWHDGYRLLRPLLAKLLASLLDDTTQDPYVVDATLSYLATMVCCFGITRSSGHNTDDLYDGILINLSTALVQIVLPMLATSAQRRRIETVYHESHLPRRVYLERPEPLRTRSERDEAKSRAQEDVRIQQYDATMASKSAAAQDFYYPPSEKHYGVLCDHCHGADFVGPRYKCAMCPDADICTTCYEAFSHKPFATTQASTSGDGDGETAAAQQIHRTDHVFYRLSVPMPLIAVYHYFPIDFTDQRPFSYEHTALDTTTTTTTTTAEVTARELECAACHTHLDEFDVIFRCSNCLEPRFVCPSCVEHEERHCDPNRAHLPGHLYLAIPRTWRQHLNPRARALYSASLVYPACIYPRERLRIETELVYMTIQTLHVGPIHSLSKFVSVVKEMQELRAFCACEEQRVESEKKMQKQQQQQQATTMRTVRPIPTPKLSAHYTASQARLADLGATRLMAEMHLLEATNVFDMIAFYSKTCRWLLELAPSAGSTQNAFADIVTQYSPTFSSFPEHFFFDVCDMVHVLTFDGTSGGSGTSGNGVDFLTAEALRGGDDQQLEMVEPLLVMLVQLLATRKCTKNPHLRVQAAKALSALVAFYAKSSKLVGVLRKVFQRCLVLKMFAVGAVLQFHEDMEGYHLRNNGLVFNNNAGSGDHLLWGFVGIRVTTVLLLRCMWQFVDQRTALARAFQAKNSTLQRAAAAASSMDPDVDVSSESRVANQVSMLIIGLWSDAAKLLEEGNGKVGVLAQLADIQEALREGRAIQLPFRESMLVGYIALHSKHLRVAMRMLVEVVELLSWMADHVPLKRAMLKSELVDQSTRTTSFLIASVMTAFQNKALESTWHHLQDSKRLFAHLVILVARCAGRGSSDKSKSPTTTSTTTVGSPSQYWSLVQESGNAMLRFIGDVDASNRWLLNRAVVRMEAARYLGEDTGDDVGSRNRQSERRDANARSQDPLMKDRGDNNNIDAHEDDDEDDDQEDADAERRDEEEEEELDENDALALLERQSAHVLTTSATLSALPVVKKRQRALTRQLGNRFISALAKDGRFVVESFVNGCELLRRRSSTTSSSSKSMELLAAAAADNDYEYVGASWMALYMEVLDRCQDMVKLQALTDELLADIPEEYLDPLLSTIMTDPVQLPSGNIVDRAVIERHLLSASASSRVDPFTREPLTLEMLVPCASLKREIRLYLRAKLQHLEHKKDDVLATWGLGWDSIFDATADSQSGKG